MNLTEQILNHLYLLTFLTVLFFLASFLAQKTDKNTIVKFGIVLIISFFLTAFNLLILILE